jgi:hypothetical protein
MTSLARRFTGIFSFLVLGFLTACSSGSSGPGSGKVVVTVTDGPTDQYERVLLTLKSMTLIGAGGHQTIYDGPPLTFDLLQLRDRADFAFSQTVTAGDYNKIRLEVIEARLVDLGDPADPNDDVEVVLDKLVANGKIDLNPQGPFTVTAGRTTVIELDIDARRSFQVVENGTGELILRPVIFTNIYEGDVILPSRLVRVFGTLDAVDAVAQTMKICGPQFVAQLGAPAAVDMNDCVLVFATGANHFGTGGVPIPFADIVDAFDMDPTLQVTAIGFAALPGDGAPADIVLNLNAVVDELGPRRDAMTAGWETSHGTLTSDPDATGCVTSQCINFLPGDAAAEITVQLQTETRVFRRDGTELMQADLANGQTGAFDALRVDNAGTEELKASLFVFGQEVGDAAVSGALVGVNIGNPIDVLTVQPEVGSPVDVCVTADSDVLRILTDGEAITIVDLLDPAVLDPSEGLQVDVVGDVSAELVCTIDAAVVIVE